MKNVVHGESGKNPSVFDFLRSKAEFEYPTEDVKVYASVISKMNLVVVLNALQINKILLVL